MSQASRTTLQYVLRHVQRIVLMYGPGIEAHDHFELRCSSLLMTVRYLGRY